MEEFLNQYGFWLIIMAPAILGAIGAWVFKIAAEWRKARVAECEVILKQEMVQRGMSADEIVQILRAGTAPHPGASPTGIGELMAEKDYKAADIVTVVQAWNALPPEFQATVTAMVEKGSYFVEIKKVVDGCQARVSR